MTILEAIILGFVQGATEFIPVSSSGHLVLIPWLLGWERPGLLYDAMLHWGTLLAVVSYFRHDLTAIASAALGGLAGRTPFATFEARLAWLLVLATLPAVVIGGLLEDFFESLFNTPALVSIFLLVTGVLLWLSEALGRRARELDTLNGRDALIIGLAQAAAIAPGISRSGSTIAAGLVLGLERAGAARFSFLMMVPIVFGAGLLQLLELVTGEARPVDTVMVAAGFIVSTVTGYLCIAFLLDYLRHHGLRVFAVWCWALGLFSLGVMVLRGS